MAIWRSGIDPKLYAQAAKSVISHNIHYAIFGHAPMSPDLSPAYEKSPIFRPFSRVLR